MLLPTSQRKILCVPPIFVPSCCLAGLEKQIPGISELKRLTFGLLMPHSEPRILSPLSLMSGKHRCGRGPAGGVITKLPVISWLSRDRACLCNCPQAQEDCRIQFLHRAGPGGEEEPPGQGRLQPPGLAEGGGGGTRGLSWCFGEEVGRQAGSCFLFGSVLSPHAFAFSVLSSLLLKELELAKQQRLTEKDALKGPLTLSPMRQSLRHAGLIALRRVRAQETFVKNAAQLYLGVVKFPT